jgi:hypothetical protein
MLLNAMQVLTTMFDPTVPTRPNFQCPNQTMQAPSRPYLRIYLVLEMMGRTDHNCSSFTRQEVLVLVYQWRLFAASRAELGCFCEVIVSVVFRNLAAFRPSLVGFFIDIDLATLEFESALGNFHWFR